MAIVNRQPPRRPRRLDERAVAARIHRIRLRRASPGTTGWFVLPLMLVVLAIGVALLTLPIAYAFFGTDIPFVVNDAGTKAPPSFGDRAKAGALGLLCWVVFIAALWRPVRDTIAFRWPHRFASRRIALTPDGVWLARGNRVVEGLEWSQVQAVSVVEEWQSTTVPTELARPPFVEVFPVKAAKESASLLGSLIVNTTPPGPGIRGKRYLIRLDCEADDIRRLAHVLDAFAPGKRVSGGPA
ncbi:hypothetical protein Snas_2462 [Stackebrandtia nassauensis DSM 44728]|uniref:PH domain-containing protein n=1 Tax=Stackebrandtia nassauensis (strain DSM 44728 / CIP 108903 / NRRL B-16338 / NBRC 102104 / LLR-40K-21) TaxID=446470 RepID=D3Q4W5_STANL|nr:hypothetical protein Snas_2462 [Stackebrandtia nassauensis DSM 44728]